MGVLFDRGCRDVRGGAPRSAKGAIMKRVSTRRVVWTGVGGVLAVLALVTLAPRTAWAQPITGTESGIVAVGFGEASAPASSASLQFLVGPGEFGMMGGMPPDMVME